MLRFVKLSVLLAAFGLSTGAIAAGKLYCCFDASGKQVCGDLLPQACYGRAYREIGSTGRTVRNVDAPLTAEQRAERAAEEEQSRIEEDALREKQRQDRALLNTYSSEKEIEFMRARARDDVLKSISAAERKIADIRKQRKVFENEAEFYQKKPMPAEVRKGLDDADFEIKAQELVIESKNKELEIIRAKYDDDRRRFLEIMSSRKGAANR